jgi:hypothetical protein
MKILSSGNTQADQRLVTDTLTGFSGSPIAVLQVYKDSFANGWQDPGPTFCWKYKRIYKLLQQNHLCAGFSFVLFNCRRMNVYVHHFLLLSF